MRIVSSAALFLFLAVLTTGCSSFDQQVAEAAGAIHRHRRAMGRTLAERAFWTPREASRDHNTANCHAI